MALERETLGFWERLMKFKDKHGYWNLTKLVLFVAFAVAIVFWQRILENHIHLNAKKR